MDKPTLPTLGHCALAFLIGAVLLFVEVYLVGIFAHYYMPTQVFHDDLSPTHFYLRGLAFSLLNIWIAPSLLAAWLLALLKPRRWLLYSACVVLPGIIELAWGLAAIQGMSVVEYVVTAESIIRILLVPLFLWLIYATIRRHTGTP